MKLSARNQFKGIVANVHEGAVNAIVTLKVGEEFVSGTISMEAVKELGLVEGREAYAVIKATEVMVGLGDMQLSARNKFAGKISEIEKGAVNSIVKMDVLGGNKLSATISNGAVLELGLKEGMDAVGVIKATSVMFGIDG